MEKLVKKEHLSALATYQEGAIVSKVIHKNKAGNITLFAFDKGEGLSEHTAPFDAWVHILDGTASIIISGEEHIVEKGEAIMMPAHEPHALQANAPFKMLLVMLKA